MNDPNVSYQIMWRLRGSDVWFPFWKRLKTRSYCERKLACLRSLSGESYREFCIVRFEQGVFFLV